VDVRPDPADPDLGGVSVGSLRRVRQGCGRVRDRAGRARRRAGRAVADHPGQVPDVAHRPANLRHVVTRRRLLALPLLWTLRSLGSVGVTTCVYSAYRIAPPARLDDAERTAVIATLRAALVGAPAVPCTVHRALDPGPVAMTLWLDGHQAARADGYGADI